MIYLPFRGDLARWKQETATASPRVLLSCELGGKLLAAGLRSVQRETSSVILSPQL